MNSKTMATNEGQVNSNSVKIGTSNAKNNDGASCVENLDLRREHKRTYSASINAPKETMNKKKRRNSTANGFVYTNKKTESNSSIQKNDSTKDTMIDDLPPEMLEALFQKVSTSDLLQCRQINRKFKEIASRVMRKRGDIKLHFAYSDHEFKHKIKHRNCELLVNICHPYSNFSFKSLTDLAVCLKESKDFPITSFRFDDLDKFGNEDLRSFLSIWGTNVLALNITLNDPVNNVGILRDLLDEKVPSLKTLTINFKWEQFPSPIELFADSNEFQLPKLQVLCVNSKYGKFRGIIANILKAACNLNKLFCFVEKSYQLEDKCVENSITTDDLAMLQSFNKLHCLKNMRIDLSEDLIAFCIKANEKIDLKLDSLAVSLEPSIWKNNQLKSSATAILNQLFHSSKDTIQTLRINPLGSLGLNIPKFKNLQKLDLFGFSKNESKIIDMFPPLFEMAENFPNLKDLGLHIHSHDAIFFPSSQPLKPMPSIEVLRIIGAVTGECRDNIMKATPNVKTLLIEERGLSMRQGFSINFHAIANYLPKLQSFGWLICTITYHDLRHLLDAVITGLPVAFCEKHSDKFRYRDSLSADELAFYQLQQRNYSILDLKELKQLDVTFLMDGDEFADTEYVDEGSDDDFQCLVEKNDPAGFGSDSILYKTGFSKVSKFLAFDLMPNLKVRTYRYLD